MRYRINAPQVIAETIGGETIVVNLATGHYFNLQGTAVVIWDDVAEECPFPEIVARIETAYEGSNGEIESSVSGFLGELEREGLIVASGGEHPTPTAPSAPSADLVPRMPFVTPSFVKFTDMQDIILLDPVHEVDARGWPHASAGA